MLLIKALAVIAIFSGIGGLSYNEYQINKCINNKIEADIAKGNNMLHNCNAGCTDPFYTNMAYEDNCVRSCYSGYKDKLRNECLS